MRIQLFFDIKKTNLVHNSIWKKYNILAPRYCKHIFFLLLLFNIILYQIIVNANPAKITGLCIMYYHIVCGRGFREYCVQCLQAHTQLCINAFKHHVVLQRLPSSPFSRQAMVCVQRVEQVDLGNPWTEKNNKNKRTKKKIRTRRRCIQHHNIILCFLFSYGAAT